MTVVSTALQDHLNIGATTLCRCWSITRKDGVMLGFTDHDRTLDFLGRSFLADAGMSAKALEQSTGLSVDNSEAVGVLSHASVDEKDLIAGRFDGAEVEIWLVNWKDTSQFAVLFKGQLGEIQRQSGTFTAELRGQTDRLNQNQGRIYQKPCSAVLGDARCRFDTSATGYSEAVQIDAITDQKILTVTLAGTFPDRWFEKGRVQFVDGAAAGLSGVVKRDHQQGASRVIELWEMARADVAPGDLVQISAGCDKRFATCKDKFSNAMNFQGFPHVPGDDWLMAVPRKSGANTGGSMN